MKYVLIIITVLVVLGGGAAFTIMRLKSGEAQAAPMATDFVVRKDLSKLVVANGKVASKLDVDIKCQASGTIKVLPYADVSKEVKPGEMLVQLDPIDMQRFVDTARAEVDADKARLKESQLNWDVSKMALETTRQRDEAALSSAQAQATDARAKAERTRQLFAAKPTALASQEELDTALTTAAQADANVENYKAAVAELAQQKIQIDTKEEQMKEMAAALAQDQSRMDTAQQNVSYCTVSAPLANDPSDPPRWYISSLLTNIAPGYIVQSGTSGFSAGTTLMTLSDLSHVYVLASVDESEIGQVADPARGGEKQIVHITADSFQGVVFEGEVVRVATKGVNTSNVVTFEVKIEVTSENKTKLRPEMTGTAKIVVGARHDVLTIPVSAFIRGGGAEMAPSTQPAASQPGMGEPATGRGRRQGGMVAAPSADGTMDGIVNVMVGGVPQARNVTVGLTDNESYEVIKGLNEGDEVVLNKMGSDSKWRAPGAAQQMVRTTTGKR